MRRPLPPPTLRGRPYATAVFASIFGAGLFIVGYGVAGQLLGPIDVPLSVLWVDLAAGLGCLLLTTAGWRGLVTSRRGVEWCAVAAVSLIHVSVMVELVETPQRAANLTAHCYLILLAAGVVIRATWILLALSAVTLASWALAVTIADTPPGFELLEWLPTWLIAILIASLNHTVVAIERAVEDEVLQAVESTSWVDPLTGLVNRHGFTAQAAQVVSAARHWHDTVWCAFVDVDHFKTVNDRCGHQSGDDVLVEVAQALRSTIRGGDLAARWGGDEFILMGPGRPPAEKGLQARLTRHLDEALDRSITCQWTPRVSVGVEAVRLDGSDPTTALLLAADRRMYARRRLDRTTRAPGQAPDQAPGQPPEGPAGGTSDRTGQSPRDDEVHD